MKLLRLSHLFLITATVMYAISVSAADQLPRLRTEGTQVVDIKGNPVALTGVNFGNWLVIENWMFGGVDNEVHDQYELEGILVERFGADEKERLMDVFRENYITDRDFKMIKTFGMNTVRLPFAANLIEDDSNPFHLREDAWEWMDKAVDLCEENGLYIILDMHGAIGMQSAMDHTGRSDFNKLWTVPEYQDRTEWVWKQVAERYKKRTCVAAYDILNEPWGSDGTTLAKFVSRCYDAVRAIDGETIIIFPGYYDGIHYYGKPKDHGWTNAMFTMHFYPGLFGGGAPTVNRHARFLARELPDWDPQMEALQAPLLVGEFNVVFKAAGGGEMMRRYFDALGERYWPATMWAYKLVKPEAGWGSSSWGMVTNQKAMARLNVHDWSKARIEEHFKGFSTMEYAVDEDLRQWMTTKETPVVLADPGEFRPIRKAPVNALPDGWIASSIDDATPAGGYLMYDEGTLEIYGGGADIWGRSDSFYFVSTPFTGDFVFSACVSEPYACHANTKAGLMVRSSLQADASHGAITLSPGGVVEFAERVLAGQSTKATSKMLKAAEKVWFKIGRQGNILSRSYSLDGKSWEAASAVDVTGLGDTVHVGLATLSHESDQLTRARYSELFLKAPPVGDLPEGWQATDVGGAKPEGRQTLYSDGTLVVEGGGNDIWSTADDFRFVWQEVDGDFTFTTTVSSPKPVHTYTKAGIMVRNSLEPNAAQVCITLSPSGGVETAKRLETGSAMTSASFNYSSPDMLWLRLTRRGQTVTTYHSLDGVEWTRGDQVRLPGLKTKVFAGFATLSHDRSQLTRVEFGSFDLE
jgi:glucan 1,3-beta-glucosidase